MLKKCKQSSIKISDSKHPLCSAIHSHIGNWYHAATQTTMFWCGEVPSDFPFSLRLGNVSYGYHF